MIYIANIIERKHDTNSLDINHMAQLIEADNESEAITKLNNYYNSLANGTISYEIVIKTITPTIS